MRTAGIVLLLGLAALLGACVAITHGSARTARADVFGIIQLYGDGSVVVETPTAGMREVLVDPLTVVREMTRPTDTRLARPSGTPATTRDLRPGRWVALWLRGGVEPRPVAREIDVWNKGQ